MDTSARAFWITAPGHGEIRDEPLGRPGPGDALVRTLFTGISRGTEAVVFQGRVPPSEYARMRAPFQQGEFPAPLKYGYANVGIVEQGPGEVRGREVFVLYPHQSRYIVPASAVHVLPPDVPAARAVLAANLETAVNIAWDARPHLGDRVVVIGAGTVGCLTAWLLRRLAGIVTLVDVRPQRALVAAALGVAFALPDEAPADADVVIHASGSGAGLQLALRVAALEATVIEASWYGDAVVPLPLGEAFHVHRLALRSSQVGRLPAAQQARWDFRRRMQLALRYLADPALEVMITGEDELDALPVVMAKLAASPGDTLCHRIRYPRQAPGSLS